MTLIARLRIILYEVEPMPMRHIEVPLKIRLDRLHEVIQAAMGWTDTHLYEFRVGDAGWGMPDQTATRTIQYVYDFGDNWAADPDRAGGRGHPGRDLSTAAEGHRGLPARGRRRRLGFEEFLEALADPDHEQHEDMVQWSGGDFDAEDVGIDSIVESFDRLARKWAPPPRKPQAET
ncbi:plasmid pRiA4b ORF-3 family protein [Thioclava sp. JM3]|uniref:plasmid pRiA4b ORF-3 family protein n=1 Tax=Thioclava sp. JM3 TaxID=1973004 RepID=UPI0023E35357|nr:plasmid pRiA4b ORF-3 family protein [Thioclava sp. JM3]